MVSSALGTRFGTQQYQNLSLSLPLFLSLSASLPSFYFIFLLFFLSFKSRPGFFSVLFVCLSFCIHWSVFVCFNLSSHLYSLHLSFYLFISKTQIVSHTNLPTHTYTDTHTLWHTQTYTHISTRIAYINLCSRSDTHTRDLVRGLKCVRVCACVCVCVRERERERESTLEGVYIVTNLWYFKTCVICTPLKLRVTCEREMWTNKGDP